MAESRRRAIREALLVETYLRNEKQYATKMPPHNMKRLYVVLGCFMLCTVSLVIYVRLLSLGNVHSLPKTITWDSIPLNESNSHPMRHSEGTQYFPSTMICNIYRNRHDIPNSIFNFCKFENVCMTRNGTFVLFMEDEVYPGSSLHRRIKILGEAPIYTQGRFDTNVGFTPIRVVDGSLVIKDGKPYLMKGYYQTGEKLEREIPHTKSFHMSDVLTFFMRRYAAGNAGHVLMDNVGNVIHPMLAFYGSLTDDFKVVFMEDATDLKSPSNYEYPTNITNKLSIDIFSLLSKYPVQQNCLKKDGMIITNAPCVDEKKVEMTDHQAMELAQCFTTMHAGGSMINFNQPHGKEMMDTQMRHFVFKRLNISLREDLKEKKEIIVFIHSKSKQGRHGRIIYNAVELGHYLRQTLPQDSFIQSLGKKVMVLTDSLSNISIKDQIYLFSQVDYYIVDQGSAGYIGMFMRETSSILVSPRCDKYTFTTECNNGWDWTLKYLAINILNYYELDPFSECVHRSTPLDSGNCDPVLKPHVTQVAVLNFLKQKYRNVAPFKISNSPTEFPEMNNLMMDFNSGIKSAQ